MAASPRDPAKRAFLGWQKKSDADHDTEASVDMFR